MWWLWESPGFAHIRGSGPAEQLGAHDGYIRIARLNQLGSFTFERHGRLGQRYLQSGLIMVER